MSTLNNTGSVSSTSINLIAINYTEVNTAPFKNFPYYGFSIIRDGVSIYIPFLYSDIQLLNNFISGGTQSLFFNLLQDAINIENSAIGSSISLNISSNTTSLINPNNGSTIKASTFNLSEINHTLNVSSSSLFSPAQTSNTFYTSLSNGPINVATLTVDAVSPSIIEGNNAVFQLTALNLPVGTQLHYTLSGVDTSDVPQLSGNFTTNLFSTNIIIPTTSHISNHGNKNLTISINEAVSTSITLIDESPPLNPDFYDGHYLTIRNVMVGNTMFKNVVCSLNNVLKIDQGQPKFDYDIYELTNNQLQISSVSYSNILYNNVLVTVGVVISYDH